MKYSNIVNHYAETGLKGRNRPFFEKKLEENIKKSLKRNEVDFDRTERRFGRILVELSSRIDREKTTESLKNVFGIANFSYAKKIPSNLEEMKGATIENIEEKEFQTFKIETKRSDKEFPKTSMEVNEEVGAYVVEKLGKEVDLENPDQTIYIEITRESTYIYSKKYEGPGGLPVGTGNKTIVLLSGGIDSPVAAYFSNKRGVENIFVHFHSYPYTNRASIKKAKKVVEILNKFQFQSKLYLVPFAEIQKEILDNTPAPLRIILYRRFMFKIAERVAERENASALTTGESIGQVGSQTLENIKAVSEAVEIPILRPLIGFDKIEIIRTAKEIGTYETSIEPCQDACTWFMPDHPETKAKVEQIKKAEDMLSDLDNLIDKTIQSIEPEIVQ